MNWKRVRDLPEDEQEPFWQYLIEFRHTRPELEGVPDEEQDGYYQPDYERWKNRKRLKPLRAILTASMLRANSIFLTPEQKEDLIAVVEEAIRVKRWEVQGWPEGHETRRHIQATIERLEDVRKLLCAK